MGEVSEMMLDGTLCCSCGIYLDDEETGIKNYKPCGYPKKCLDCENDD